MGKSARQTAFPPADENVRSLLGRWERRWATRKAALVIGRQNTVDMESPVYVFSEEVQVIT